MSICSGGRYENLATDLSNVKLPGVGISIGLSRIMAIMKGADLLPKGRPTPTEVMVAYTPGITQQMQIAASRTLRRQGLKVEVYPGPTKLDKQMKYADHKKIRFVYFCGSEGREDQVKDMDSGAQTSLANSRLMGLGLE